MSKTKHFPYGRLLPAGLALGLTLAASAAFAAAELEFMTGTACHPNRADSGKINYSSTWGVFNENTSSAGTVYCPVVYEPDGSLNRSVQIVTYDQNSGSGKDVSCTVNGLNEDGTVGFSGGTQKTSGSSSSPQYLWFDIDDYYIYNVICSIPHLASGKQSRVVNYGTYLHD